MDVDLAKGRLPGVHEAMRRVRRDDDDTAGSYFALLSAHGDDGAAFDRERDFDVGMRMQGRTLSRFGVDDVGGEGRAVFFADEIV